jgi:hypothetical protein
MVGGGFELEADIIRVRRVTSESKTLKICGHSGFQMAKSNQ